MSEQPVGDRRAGGATASSGAFGRIRRRLAAVPAGLFRTLAADDDRAGYWLRHVRIGVVVTGISALAVAGYALLTDEPSWTAVRPARWTRCCS